MQTLLDAGANPYVKSNLNWTALSYAIKQGHAEVVKTFIDYGIDIKRRHGSMTPLGFAKENQEISHMLRYAGATK